MTPSNLCLWVASAVTVFRLGIAQPAFPAVQFSGLMGGDGRVHFDPAHGPGQYAGHAPVLAGCPQWGWGGPMVQLPVPPPGVAHTPYDSHWSNQRDVWALPTAGVGFQDLTDGVGVFLRSHAPDMPEPDFYGETNQNDGWFRFQVLIPPGNTNAELDFTLQLTNRIDGRTNYWFSQYCWDWAGTNAAQIVFRPLTRVLDPLGPANTSWSWRNTMSLDDPTGLDRGRAPARRFKIIGVPTALEHEVYLEVAQGLPYTLPDLEAFWSGLSQTLLPAGLVLERTNFAWPQGSGYTGYLTGLSTFPPGHKDAETNNSFFSILIRTNTTPPLVAPPLVFITAGTHYEPPGPLVCEGIVRRIIEGGYWKHLTFVIVPVCNPDAFAWGVTVLRPFGTKYSGAGAGPGSGVLPEHDLENGMSWYREDQDDVEAVVLREHLKTVRARFPGSTMLLHLDLHSDLCPHPDGWEGAGGAEYRGGPPVYGLIMAADEEQRASAEQFAARMDATPHLGPYLRSPLRWRVNNPCWPWPPEDYGNNVGANICLVLEFDEACLYRDSTPNDTHGAPPVWLVDPPPPFLRCATNECYWVDGPLARAEYYHRFGRDIADAIAAYFSPVSAPSITLLANHRIEVRWTEGVLQQTTRLEGEATQWTDVVGVASPWTTALSSGDVMFFRTKRPSD
ncbi:MAG TPA: hypothetical protein P5525_19895 [Candidatus Paceibacterota bacterium]|nr:hypothetical protein [Candidatus Paceibacterota bacterium]